MKKIFKYLSILLSVALLGSISACNLLMDPLEETAEAGLGIKVFFPTKVVAGQPMTINGNGFATARSIEFPNGVSVTDFEIVSNQMIRVVAPAGIAADGGVIKVVTAEGEAVSRPPASPASPCRLARPSRAANRSRSTVRTCSLSARPNCLTQRAIR